MTMKLSTQLNYAGGFKEAVDQVVELEKVGLDIVWVAEAYSFDAVSSRANTNSAFASSATMRF